MAVLLGSQHIYESDDATIALVRRIYLRAFDRVAIWHGEAPDLILLGFADGEGDGDGDFERLKRRARRADFRRQLADLGLTDLPRLLAHELMPAGVLTRGSLPGPVHTLEHPRLSDTAARAFFRGSEGHLPSLPPNDAASAPLWRLYREQFANGLPDADRLEFLRETCQHSLARCSTPFAEWLHEDPSSPALAEALGKARRNAALAVALDDRLLRTLASFFDPRPAAAISEQAGPWRHYFHYSAPFATFSDETARASALDSRGVVATAKLAEVK